jgi:hypothetical protein
MQTNAMIHGRRMISATVTPAETSRLVPGQLPLLGHTESSRPLYYANSKSNRVPHSIIFSILQLVHASQVFVFKYAGII